MTTQAEFAAAVGICIGNVQGRKKDGITTSLCHHAALPTNPGCIFFWLLNPDVGYIFVAISAAFRVGYVVYHLVWLGAGQKKVVLCGFQGSRNGNAISDYADGWVISGKRSGNGRFHLYRLQSRNNNDKK